MAGVYLHIPFCESRCVYCGFFSSTLMHKREAYVGALCREMELRRNYLQGERIETVYLGGGTPSTLTACQLQRLFSHIYKVYNVADGAEVTIECNPDDVTPEFCNALRTLPVNRVSMGAQTFSDARLLFLRRRHKSGDVARAVENLRQAGVRNISVDLMFGFPHQTLEEWRDDISKALQLRLQHVSAYSLMYEEGTPLYRMLEAGRVEETDEELYRQMYDTLIDMLTQNGYEHYEISNFCLPGYHSRHNNAYWNGTPYIGLGAAAHSYDVRTRSWNVSDIDKYINDIMLGTLPSESEEIDTTTRYNDRIVTALRTREGISIDSLSAKEREYLMHQAQPFIDASLMHLRDGHISLTREGIYISDTIMAELIAESLPQ